MKKRVLFLVPYPHEGPSVRLRVEQFLPSVAADGIEFTIRPFLTPAFYSILYKKGNIFKKYFLFLFCSARRFVDIVRALFYDLIFIHREAYPIGPPFLEAVLFLCGRRVVFDYDDAIYLPPQGSSYIISILKCPWKTAFITRHSRYVIVGNEYLKNYASRFNKSTTIIPTCIDTDRYKKYPAHGSANDVVIGWIGSHTTQIFLKELETVFAKLASKYKNLKIHLIGARPGLVNNGRVAVKEWSLAAELDEMGKFDIGIMPMPDTKWTRGKCAFKAILYMSLEIPVVVSPVGVNRKIIKDGMNGFLAETGAEWEAKLSRLIEDASLRRSMGQAGRSTVTEAFSLKVNAPLFESVLKRSLE